jgi:hypothetical protein
MSAIIKMPSDLMQKDVQSGLVKLEEFHNGVANLDNTFNVVDIRAAYNATPDTSRVTETIEAIRIRLASLTQKFKYQEEPSYRNHALQFSSNGRMEKADQQQRISYHDLRKYLQYHEVELPLSEESLKIWKDLQIKKLPGWFHRLTTRRKDVQPGYSLDMHVDLCEQVLREIPAYGKAFEIPRDSITYSGNLQALQNAFKCDRLKGVIVETYPGNLRQYRLNATTWAILLDMIGAWDVALQYSMGSGRLYYHNIAGANLLTNDFSASAPSRATHVINVSSAKMQEKAGIAQLKFIFEIADPKHELSVDAQVSNRGAKYPTLTELLFFGLGSSNPGTFPALERGYCYYRIANEFNSGVYPETPDVYVCVSQRYYEEQKKPQTTLIFTSDIIGDKYDYVKALRSFYVL